MKRVNNLYSSFYTSFDPSVVLGFVVRLISRSEEERRRLDSFLGEGYHFQSFECQANSLALAVNVAKSSFLNQGDIVLQRWKKAIDIARAMETVSLMPPMEIIRGADYLAIVMPKGQTIDRSSAQNIDELLRETARALGEVGLALDDYPQLREACGVPFIIDWSDLNFVTSQR